MQTTSEVSFPARNNDLILLRQWKTQNFTIPAGSQYENLGCRFNHTADSNDSACFTYTYIHFQNISDYKASNFKRLESIKVTFLSATELSLGETYRNLQVSFYRKVEKKNVSKHKLCCSICSVLVKSCIAIFSLHTFVLLLIM